MLGMTLEFNPRFLREEHFRFIRTDIKKAVKNYISDVKSQKFPNKDEQY